MYVSEDAKLLRAGYTTGSCATAAAKAALLSYDHCSEEVEIQLPSGEKVEFNLLYCRVNRAFSSIVTLDEQEGTDVINNAMPIFEGEAAVIKDAGDDADVTDGATLVAHVRIFHNASGQKITTSIRGGEGVGKVTKGGLQLPVGEWAINPAPRKMIWENLEDDIQRIVEDMDAQAKVRMNYHVVIEISVPGGIDIAKKTFNEKLGIIGGISIIGTTGIVRPMDERAFKAAIYTEIQQKSALGVKRLILVPGKHGENFAVADGYSESEICHMSNYVGFALSSCRSLGISEVVIMGHIGKLIKVAGGIFNTHSKIADARAEILVSYMAMAGCTPAQLSMAYHANTSDEAASLLVEEGLEEIYEVIAQRAKARSMARVASEVAVDVVLFDMKGKKLGDTRGTFYDQ